MSDLLSSPRPAGAADERLPDGWCVPGTAAPAADELARARAEATVLLADHGVTYGAEDDERASADFAAGERDAVPTDLALRPGSRAGDADVTPSAWRLDPVPVVVDEAEWGVLEGGLAERAEALDAVLADLYSARSLLTDRLLPPETVLPHPGFLRAMDGIRLPGGRELVLGATDLCRDAHGGWCVIADRSQAPSGAGYAMEDRRVVAQVLPGVYRRSSIRRLGPFFRALRLALQDAAPPGVEQPRVVLLTSGPYSETAFDQAYLASVLGLPMVEGSDLVMREGRVWVRGLDGLDPVDVVLRRVDADWCDPLDLRPGSRLGVPGLVRAVRSGTVSVVNPLGSSVLESPAVLAYLPRLAREVLGRDLALPSAPTWWCGDDTSRRHVLARLDELVLLPTVRGARGGAIPGWTLSSDERERLAGRIAAEPWSWVGQEPVAPAGAGSGAPGAPGDGTPRAAVLRAFTTAHAGSYAVMAGGLARVSGAPAGSAVSSAGGAVAKDVWVLSTQDEATGDAFPRVRAGARPAARPVARVSPRTAENLFWIGRYAERAEGQVRVLRAALDRWDDYHRSPASPGGRALAVLLTALVGEDDDGRDPQESLRVGVHALGDRTLEPRTPGTVAYAIRRLSIASSAVRDQLSGDTWGPIAHIERALTSGRLRARHRPPGLAPADEGFAVSLGLRSVLDDVLEGLLALAGIGAESLVRDVGWRFLDAGRRIERAQQLVTHLRATALDAREDDVDRLVQESVLLAHESAVTARRRSPSGADTATVLDLLVLDRTNPRSLAFQLDRLRDDLAEMPPTRRAPDTHLLQDVVDLVAELDPAAVSDAVDEDGRRVRLAETLESMRWRLRRTADDVARAHFVHPTPSRELTESWGAGGARAGGADA